MVHLKAIVNKNKEERVTKKNKSFQSESINQQNRLDSSNNTKVKGLFFFSLFFSFAVK